MLTKTTQNCPCKPKVLKYCRKTTVCRMLCRSMRKNTPKPNKTAPASQKCLNCQGKWRSEPRLQKELKKPRKSSRAPRRRKRRYNLQKKRLTRKGQPTAARKAEKSRQKAARGLRRAAQKAKNAGILIETLRSRNRRKITKLRKFSNHF